jgi:hypothetical protein
MMMYRSTVAGRVVPGEWISAPTVCERLKNAATPFQPGLNRERSAVVV